LSLVHQLTLNLIKTNLSDSVCHLLVGHHTLRVQVLDHDNLGSRVADGGGEVMTGVLSVIAHALPDFSNLTFQFDDVPRLCYVTILVLIPLIFPA
jgi:hypothetical protein